MRIRLSILFFRILRKSKVFDYFYRRHLNELLLNLELCDITAERQRVQEYYKAKLLNLDL